MIPLGVTGVARHVTRDLLGKVSLFPVAPDARQDTVRVLLESPGKESLEGYTAIIATAAIDTKGVPAVLACNVAFLEQGDVVSISPQGYVRTVYRRSSQSNTLFATDRCNSLCLMCSQPPREVDDSGRVAELIRLVYLIDSSAKELGISGGEPTLLGYGLFDVIAACRDRLPNTSIHLLSNGRRFFYRSYARALGGLSHPDLMVGVPVYSDVDTYHEYIVQAKGAFAETIVGLQNLAEAQVPVEIRIVVHRHTYRRLPQLAEFIYRNLTFAAHVAFMGLEVIGFAKSNVTSLLIDPVDYAAELETAVLLLASVGMNVSIYNHQLCTIPESLWPFSRMAISDWKNDYADECTDCSVRPRCGGFFTWNLKQHRSRAIRAL